MCRGWHRGNWSRTVFCWWRTAEPDGQRHGWPIWSTRVALLSICLTLAVGWHMTTSKNVWGWNRRPDSPPGQAVVPGGTAATDVATPHAASPPTHTTRGTGTSIYASCLREAD